MSDTKTTRDQITRLSNFLIHNMGFSYAAGFWESTAVELIDMLPVRKREAFLKTLTHSIESNVMVTVKNCLTGVDVQIPLSYKGTVLDPSMESYHSF